MQIPLDYYRILQVTLQASAEQLQQNYRDLTLQLPRREYTNAAIAARKQLLDEAYAILSDPKQRHNYNHKYFSRSYDPEVTNTTQELVELSPNAFVPYTPSIEIAPEQFIGALLILQELAEYVLVLSLGNTYLSNTSVNDQISQAADLSKPDVVLTVALANLELGREQWQQKHYEKAATFLDNGYKLLLHENLFLNVRNEIQSEIYVLRPYRIRELLAKPEKNVSDRSLGWQLLQDILQQRRGIDGTGNDGSGLGIDDFLRFIQQLRNYLTVAEQQKIFVAESQRPSPVATYLAVYALIAQGFSQRQPQLIYEAKQLLRNLEKRQDVYLEQAVCSLLLGQTVIASRELELSQEYETLALIREHSHNDPDLLPGLCLYTERWLQTEVFPQFRDLAQEKASLKNYFANRQVQAYLEALPIQVDMIQENVSVTSHSHLQTSATSTSPSREIILVNKTNKLKQRLQEWGKTIAKNEPRSEKKLLPATHTEKLATATLLPSTQQTAASTSSTIDTAKRIVKAPNSANPKHRNPALLAQRPQRRHNRGLSISSQTKKQLKNVLRVKKTRLILLGFGSLLTIFVLGFLVNRTFAWLKQTFFPTPAPIEQPLVQLNRPVLLIPDPNSVLPATEEQLTSTTAKQVIQNWLYTKTTAFGSNHAVADLERILVPPVLSRWQRLVRSDQANNIYRQYKHSLKIDSVQTQPGSDRAQVQATVIETAQVYENGKLNRNASYHDNLRVRYDVVRQNGQWRIREMKVLK